MSKYGDIARQSLEGFETVKIDSSTNIEKLIIDKSAESELCTSTTELKRSIEQAIESFSREKLYPKLEFTNIREQGLRVWGKKSNIAISQFTMSRIFHELASIADPQKIMDALFKAGCESAVQFFSDFLQHLRFGHELMLPDNEIEFLGLMGIFDQRSGWWSEKPRYEFSENSVLILIKKPFTSFPWVENDPHTFNDFLCGYFQTLFNCSSDFLRVIHWINGKSFKSQYCVQCTFEETIRPELLNLKLFVTHKYVPEFEEIDKILFSSYKGFISHTNGKSNINFTDFPEYYHDLILALKEAFGEMIAYSLDISKELSMRREKYFQEHLPNQLLLDIKMNYQALKIEELFKLDASLREVITGESRGVD